MTYAGRDLGSPAKAGTSRHEADKDPSEILPVLRAILRPGECVLDCFAGSGAWIREALGAGFSVLAVERQPEWAAAIAQGRRELPL